MLTADEVRQQIRDSLGLPSKTEPSPTVPIEGHLCDYPLWSYSKRRSSVTTLKISYDDGSFFRLTAPEGMPSPSFPGYLDVVLFFGQKDLFIKEHVEISIYQVFKTLGMDPNNGGNYASFRQDMKRAFTLYMVTDRFRHPQTGQRSHVEYFRVLRRMTLAKSRRDTSTFYFDDLFLQSLRSGYLKRLNFDYCLWLDKQTKALSRFLYSHIMKRLGTKDCYSRNMTGFLHDVGLGYLADLEPKRRNEKLKQTLYPALDLLKGEAFRHYQTDDSGNILFIPKD